MGLSIKQKQDYAKLLYLKTTMTQKEIAEKISVTEKTLGSWVRKGDWEVLRASYTVTKEQELRRIYMQINALNDKITSRPEGQRFATSMEADILSKLASTARSLETETGLSSIVDSGILFLDWLRPVDFELAQKVSEYYDGFIKDRLSRF